ncbi:hypothetical protein, partial [Microcystis sp. M109S1]|uniref:hypothetical protein n=1 Tax=Microcystis sp. M109S1 TaxID=2771100 RepID=UPI0025866E70
LFLRILVTISSFNFLASLINGNLCTQLYRKGFSEPFNFLASLINGNHPNKTIGSGCSAFNFLASLINGNTKPTACVCVGFLLTS